MNSKILVIVYIPMLEREYEIYVPTVKRVGTIKNLIIKVVEENSDGTFLNDGTKYLYDKITGEKIEDNLFVKYSNIKNGTKLVLY